MSHIVFLYQIRFVSVYLIQSSQEFTAPSTHRSILSEVYSPVPDTPISFFYLSSNDIVSSLKDGQSSRGFPLCWWLLPPTWLSSPWTWSTHRQFARIKGNPIKRYHCCSRTIQSAAHIRILAPPCRRSLRLDSRFHHPVLWKRFLLLRFRYQVDNEAFNYTVWLARQLFDKVERMNMAGKTVIRATGDEFDVGFWLIDELLCLPRVWRRAADDVLDCRRRLRGRAIVMRVVIILLDIWSSIGRKSVPGWLRQSNQLSYLHSMMRTNCRVLYITSTLSHTEKSYWTVQSSFARIYVSPLFRRLRSPWLL